MAFFEIPDNPEYKENIRKFEITDPGHADLFNAVAQDLINNNAYLKGRIDQAVAVAVGRNQARVFDTTADMEAWIADPANAGAAGVGANLYIRDTEVPDWWVAEVLEEADEAGNYYKISQLETQKVDLTPIEERISELNTGMDSCFQSVSDGKAAVAAALTGQGVATAGNATFAALAVNVTSAGNARYNAGVAAADARANPSSTNYKSGYNAGYSAGVTAGGAGKITVSTQNRSNSIVLDAQGRQSISFTFAFPNAVLGLYRIDVSANPSHMRPNLNGTMTTSGNTVSVPLYNGYSIGATYYFTAYAYGY